MRSTVMMATGYVFAGRVSSLPASGAFCYNPAGTMDATLLNRIGIAVELIGTLLAAPELIDRTIGLHQLERLFERSLGRVRILTERYFRMFAPPDRSSTIVQDIRHVFLTLIAFDYLIAYVAIIVLVGASRDFGNLGSWWFFWAFGVWPALASAIWALWSLVSAIRHEAASPTDVLVLAAFSIVAVPVVIAISHVALITAPALIAVSFISRRLEAGWVRTTSLILGASLFVIGLLMQFASTF